mgnify:CR=1 FL=1
MGFLRKSKPIPKPLDVDITPIDNIPDVEHPETLRGMTVFPTKSISLSELMFKSEEQKKKLQEILEQKEKAIQEFNAVGKDSINKFNKQIKDLGEQYQTALTEIQDNVNIEIQGLIDKVDSKMQEHQNMFNKINNVVDSFAKLIKSLDDMQKQQLETILSAIQLSKKKKVEIEDKLKELRLKLTHTHGEEYNKTLSEYMALKNKHETQI